MPTLFDISGIRIAFFLRDHEPVHVHIECSGHRAKIQVVPEIKVLQNNGIKEADLKRAVAIVAEKREAIIAAWAMAFGGINRSK